MATVTMKQEEFDKLRNELKELRANVGNVYVIDYISGVKKWFSDEEVKRQLTDKLNEIQKDRLNLIKKLARFNILQFLDWRKGMRKKLWTEL